MEAHYLLQVITQIILVMFHLRIDDAYCANHVSSIQEQQHEAKVCFTYVFI